MSSPTSAVTQVSGSQASGTQSSPASAKNELDPLSQKDTFLKLMVEQLRHQNPMSPSDSNQFLTQLAQFTQLEQITNVRTNTDSINAILTKAFGAAPTDTGGTTDAGGSTGDSSSTGNSGVTN